MSVGLTPKQRELECVVKVRRTMRREREMGEAFLKRWREGLRDEVLARYVEPWAYDTDPRFGPTRPAIGHMPFPSVWED